MSTVDRKRKTDADPGFDGDHSNFLACTTRKILVLELPGEAEAGGRQALPIRDVRLQEETQGLDAMANDPMNLELCKISQSLEAALQAPSTSTDNTFLSLINVPPINCGSSVVGSNSLSQTKILWLDIMDIVSPPKNWGPMRNQYVQAFWHKKVSYQERVKIASFAYANGLNFKVVEDFLRARNIKESKIEKILALHRLVNKHILPFIYCTSPSL